MNDTELNVAIMEASIIESSIYQEVLRTITISESSKLSIGIIPMAEQIEIENLFKQYLAYLITRNKMFQTPVTIQDIQKAIDNTLRRQQAERGWSDEELQSQINSQVNDLGIIQSLYYELRRNKVPYILPK
jgi:hypothetical protein